jgi:hypothetical protein
VATTDYEEPDAPTFTIVRAIKVVEQATGTDDRLTPRMLLAFIVLGIVVALAPTPAAIAGAIALIVLILEAARIAWRKPPLK